MTADTPVAIGSTTKGMTAMAVMQLVEEGRVANVIAVVLVEHPPPMLRVLHERASPVSRACASWAKLAVSHERSRS